MNKKYYILVLTFLCLLSGQASYAFGNEGYFQDEFEDYGDHEFAGDPDNGCYGMTCGEDLDEILLTYSKDEEVDDPEYNPCDTCECDPTFCYEEDESLYDDCPSGDDCECYGMGCNDEETEEDIINEVEDPCLKAAVDNVINGKSTNPFTKILNSDFYKQDDVSLKFTQYHDINEINTDAKLAPGGLYKQNIKLNLAALDNASQEFITATIYHEIIHAYMRSEGITESTQHEVMATDWRDDISDQLQLDYPNLSKEDADALAWEGLGSTNLWKTMYDDDIKNNTGITGDIAAINQNHKNINNSTDGKYGTPCTN